MEKDTMDIVDERTSLLVSREISGSPSPDDNKELPPAKHESNATYGTLDGDSCHVASRVQERLPAEHEVRLRATTSVDARLEPQNDLDARCSLLCRGRSNSDPVERHHLDPDMDAGILRALKTVKSNPYVQYVGLGLAGLVTQKELHDQQTGAPLRKTKMQLIRISAAVCGIELCYAAETAFVSPILLKLGVPPSLMTMVWCLSPILGFFLVPIMGSLSDRCSFKLGRRRPFIIIMSIGIILGLALVPNGEILGIWIGDSGNETINARPHLNSSIEDLIPKRSSLGFSFTLPPDHLWGIIFTILGVAMLDFNCDACQSPCRAYLLDVCVPEDHPTGLTMFTVMAGLGGTVGYIMGGIDWNATSFGEALGGHIRVVFSVVLIAFFVFVTLTLTSFREIPLKDLSIKKSELQKVKKKVGKSKYRKFTNEDTSSSGEEEQTEGSDIGRVERVSSYGALCETDKNALRKQNADLTSHSEADKDKHQIANISDRHWTVSDNLHNDTNLNKDSENQLVKEINYGDSVYPKARSANSASGSTIPEIRSIEVSSLNSPQIYDSATSYAQSKNSSKATSTSRVPPSRSGLSQSYQCNGSLASGERQGNPQHKGSSVGAGVRDVIDTVEVSTDVTLKTYLKSIIRMPKSMWILCLCNLLCWMSLVCYSLYFTDFVGQSVYGGDPMAPVGTDLHDRYDAGVRLGSFAMSLYSFSCACYSLGIERLVQRFRAKKVYVIGQLVFTLGMAGMAVSRSKIAVILLSPAAGIMYATLFTMPYLLVAHYHTRGMFSHGDPSLGDCKQVRGLGTDVAIISSMVFLAQFLLSVLMGTVVTAVDSTVAVIVTSAILSFLGSLTATQVTYLDL
ncbi:proton-associated sugar transporter A-like [Biomphalaria glabrata]|uniref:Proton-associated sugar transporter A-like n=1 Tax=Biomphalaria glabrata TaxID=6526 RepID=A0A9W2YC61_BIOGL|nr:proton-associated sugar transporter A-like [Biomphalaria glabrata]